MYAIALSRLLGEQLMRIALMPSESTLARAVDDSRLSDEILECIRDDLASL